MRLYRPILFIFILLVSCTHLKKAHQALDAGNHAHTLELCRTALQTDSTDTDAMVLMSDTYLAMHKVDSSIAWLEKAQSVLNKPSRRINEKLVLLYNLSGKILLKQKSFYPAIKEFEKSLSLSPDSPQTIKLLGNASYQAGWLQQSGDWYNKLIVTPDSVTARTMLDSIDVREKEANEKLQKGIVLLKERKYSKATKIIEQSLQLKSDSKEAKYQLNMAKALPLYRKGQKSGLWEAIEYFGLAVSLFPDRAEPHYFMGMAYHKKDKDEYENALSEFDLAINADPGSEYADLSLKKKNELINHRKKMKEFLSR